MMVEFKILDGEILYLTRPIARLYELRGGLENEIADKHEFNADDAHERGRREGYEQGYEGGFRDGADRAAAAE